MLSKMLENPALLSAIVAATAVIVSAIMQFLTLAITRLNTVSSLRVGATEASINLLRSTLSEYTLLVQRMHEAWARALQDHTQVDADYDKLQDKEAMLWVTLQLLLDLGNKAHHAFLLDLMEFRRSPSTDQESFFDRRQRLLERAAAVIRYDRRRALI